MAPMASLASLRVYDLTAMATLGLTRLYDSIGARLEGGVAAGMAGSSASPVTASTHTQSSRSIDTEDPRVPGCEHAFSAGKDAAGGGDTISQRAARSTRKRVRSKNGPPMPTGDAARLTSPNSARAKKVRISSSHAETQLRSAFERVRVDDRSDNAGVSNGDACGNKTRSHSSHAGTMQPANDSSENTQPKEYGEVWFNRYVIVGKLGEGAFSEVFLAADLFIDRMGKKRDCTRLVTIKRMNSRDGLIGLSDYHVISLLNRMDPKSRVPIVRAFDIFRSPSQMPESSYSESQHRGEGDSAFSASRMESLDESGTESSSTITIREAPDAQVCIVMEPLLGKTLNEAFPARVKEIYATNDEVVAKQVHMGMIQAVGRQLLMALAHMHSNSLIHADIKSTNVICIDNSSLRVKLIDFGNAVSDDDVAEYYKTFEIQTVWFRAPEVVYQQPFGRAIDMWSIACILCELWLGRSLFTDMDNRGLIRSMWKLRGPPPARIYSASPVYRNLAKSWGARPGVGLATAAAPGRLYDLSARGIKSSLDWDPHLRCRWLKYSLRVDDDDFVSLVDALLEYDPEERLTASEALRHPFFQGVYAY
ncbi:kinase-like protein [Linderina pennispora]|uniref:Kinase-like protein n=1 Tax=Linderina pennispora TaxID=61395 RepID=A0A1Y1W8V1_9FUNG|nr:kinase-like protein [Linderina pennispora]ORX69943.1 kinase-like protein [Linderina pennispora]